MNEHAAVMCILLLINFRSFPLFSITYSETMKKLGHSSKAHVCEFLWYLSRRETAGCGASWTSDVSPFSPTCMSPSARALCGDRHPTLGAGNYSGGVESLVSFATVCVFLDTWGFFVYCDHSYSVGYMHRDASSQKMVYPSVSVHSLFL